MVDVTLYFVCAFFAVVTLGVASQVVVSWIDYFNQKSSGRDKLIEAIGETIKVVGKESHGD